MDDEELETDLIRIDNNGFLVDEDTYVVNSEDVLEQEENNSDSNYSNKNEPLREQDRFLPIANIAKIMKKGIPDKGKIAKDARECVQECLSEFISFVTSEASDRCLMEKRKTINGEDVLYALSTLGFDRYVEPLKLYLKKYREIIMSPVTLNKVAHKGILLTPYSGNDPNISAKQEGQKDSSNEDPPDSPVMYTYQKVVGDFTIV